MKKIEYDLVKMKSNQLFSKDMNENAIKLFEKQVAKYIDIRDNFKPVNYLKEKIKEGKLILPENTLLHFSKSSVVNIEGDKINIILNNIKEHGILNGGALGLNVESQEETHAVVDCWKIKHEVSYEYFANLNQEVKNPSTLDRTYGKYVPYKHLTEFTVDIPKKTDKEERNNSQYYQDDLLHRIGWIVTPQKSQKITEYLNQDVFANQELGKEFKHENFACHMYKINDDKGEEKTITRHATVLFGIPENLISGIVLNYDDLYNEDFLKTIYGYFNDKVIAAPNGDIIHVPNTETKLDNEQQDHLLFDMLQKAQLVVEKEEKILKISKEIGEEISLNL